MKIIVFIFSSLTVFQWGLAQTNVFGTLTHQSLQRSYILHLPPGYEATEVLPLVVFLHGGGGSSLSAQGFTLFNQASNTNGFAVAYPQGFTEIAPNSYVWADGRGTAADKAGIDDVGFVNRLVDTLLANYQIDPDRIYLCGFSNGSFLTQRIAFEGNARFAAMGTLGGTLAVDLFDTGDPGRAIPMIYIFGMDDPLVPFEGGLVAESESGPVVGIEAAVDYWRTNNQCQTALLPVELPDLNTTDSSTVTVFEYSDCACNNARVIYYEIAGAGHTWPGVELPDYELIAGQTNEDIFASQVLWDFFQQFSLCSDPVTVREAEEDALVQIFPNPVGQTLFVEAVSPVETIALYDGQGRLLRTLYPLTLTFQLTMAGLPQGIYFIKMRLMDGRTVSELVVKQ